MLPAVQTRLEKHGDLRKHISYNGNGVLMLEGNAASIRIKEEPSRLNVPNESAYQIISPIFRYRPDVRPAVTTLFVDCLNKEGKTSRIISSPFIHHQSHEEN
jgi:hypothetical protein